MNKNTLSGLFVCEGTSDLPLADVVENLFLGHGYSVRLSKPDFDLLTGVPRDVESRIVAGMKLLRRPVDMVVVHRDADSSGWKARRKEIRDAVSSAGVSSRFIPVIPIRMTEAWLLLDERAIRQVAGNPKGRMNLPLPKAREVENVADPKQLLRECLLLASGANGRRRNNVANRFPQHRRQLLERLDCTGPVTRLSSWVRLEEDISSAVNGGA